MVATIAKGCVTIVIIIWGNKQTQLAKLIGRAVVKISNQCLQRSCQEKNLNEVKDQDKIKGFLL